MKFNFKIQQYQTDAVDAVVKVFQGQGYHDKISYIRDLGKKQENQQMRLNVDMDQQYSLDMGQSHQLNIYDMDDDTGYKNEVIELPNQHSKASKPEQYQAVQRTGKGFGQMQP